MVFPQIEDDDMALFYRNTELVQWLINGRVASLQDKLVTAVPLTATARDATHRLPTQDVIANFFNTQSMAAGLAGGGGAPASNLITRLARPQENIHCGTNAQPKATETDPWAQHDPWRSYHPVQQAHAVTGPTEGMQQIEERIQTAVLAKTQVPMEDDIPDRVQALEGQVHQLLAKQQGLEVQFTSTVASIRNRSTHYRTRLQHKPNNSTGIWKIRTRICSHSLNNKCSKSEGFSPNAQEMMAWNDSLA